MADEFDYALPALPEDALKQFARKAQKKAKKKAGGEPVDDRDIFTRDELTLLQDVVPAQRRKITKLPPDMRERALAALRDGGPLGLHHFLKPLFPTPPRKVRMDALKRLAGRARDTRYYADDEVISAWQSGAGLAHIGEAALAALLDATLADRFSQQLLLDPRNHEKEQTIKRLLGRAESYVYREELAAAQHLPCYEIAGELLDRIPYGQESWPAVGAALGDTCSECPAKLGQYHTEFCAEEQCPRCHGRWGSCGCR
jgi:hypothetical protein